MQTGLQFAGDRSVRSLIGTGLVPTVHKDPAVLTHAEFIWLRAVSRQPDRRLHSQLDVTAEYRF